MRQLLIYHNEVRAGVLTEMEPGSNYRFEYDKEYLNSPLPPISITLPKTRFFYESQQLFPFFANLLPEGALRRVVCREHHIDKNDLFGILYAMADADTIGAINFKTPNDEGKQSII